MSFGGSIYKTDYHVHTYYSDGKAWPEEYISRAIDAGLSEIGFSDHLTLTGEQQDWSIKLSLLDEYINRIIKLKENENALIVRLGLEVDYFPGKEEEISGYIAGLPLDYVIGSVHYMEDSSVDLGPEYYENKDIDMIFEKYFGLVAQAASSGLFDFMAHPDLVRIFRYHPSHNAEPLYRSLAGQLKKSGVAFEVNTNGMNKPLRDFYPDRRYLHIFREEGVPVLVNSDAHSPARLGQHFDEAYRLLKKAGFTEMATYHERKPEMKKFTL
ncbi:MAG TPA: histidinol-phosphatase HisJ family protein [Bacteroidetes bacterium]|nr:histidinol-phosphatase HisJ family protein [Bacteroidota bacterium]